MTKCAVAALADLDAGNPLRRVEIDGVPICLARLASGEVFAISDLCSHEDIELSDGDLDGDDVECPAHGSRFNVRTGEVSGLPAEEPVATYAVTVEDGQIFVDMKEAEV
ncbi:Rieske (2Fe-2S) protein [Mycobacterium sp. CBMA 234]|uniref:Rieske 2Fe-2S domain-containing protein n=1 Tax=Mycolicibacterium sp. CBMA 234 TaxID=1918495 RepID=UPI0012DD455D|nr:Rieske 2Fe-2S domain-containing protein [Mycolicibacterium sp. CBMA 234]MUL64563.1 Rieske (2Fe-2S) protein [Mycolicibacterium sp. CBMA 234]